LTLPTWTLSAWSGLALAGGLLTFILVFVFGVLALRNDQAAVCCTGTVKRDAQLRNCNRRHQGAGEQDVAKLLQLPDGFEWQVALLKSERRIIDAQQPPDRGTFSALLRPDFGKQTQRLLMNSSSPLRCVRD